MALCRFTVTSFAAWLNVSLRRSTRRALLLISYILFNKKYFFLQLGSFAIFFDSYIACCRQPQSCLMLSAFQKIEYKYERHYEVIE